MADNKSVYDNLVCGNCGYDGGRKHMQEKLEWQERLSRANEMTEGAHMSRHWSFALAAVVCTAILSASYCQTNTVQRSPSAYEACLNISTYIGDGDARAKAISECTTAFKKNEAVEAVKPINVN